MAMNKELVILLLQFILENVHSRSRTHEKPVTLLKWPGRCTQNAYALNDCNWCHCNARLEYTCDARVCALVDKFGHFNDAIRDFDVGMEGKGVWRTTDTACEPGVQYRREKLLCVCTEDGNWPSPVCRDVFRVLHPVELTGDLVAEGQRCSPSKLYVVGCNVCFCPSEGKLDAKLCTSKKCSKDDPVLQDQGTNMEDDQYKIQDEEIYAECDPNNRYKIGCKTCTCLNNNRLHCSKCTAVGRPRVKSNSFCSHVQPGEVFNRNCNMCYCDKAGFAYCSTKKCLPEQSSVVQLISLTNGLKTNQDFTHENCVPGHLYKLGCNICFCSVVGGTKVFGCTLTQCSRSVTPEEVIHVQCVKGTFYELNCLICQCDDLNGVKTQLCWVNPKCTSKEASREARSTDLDSMHGYCEPLHVYKKGCNTCHCLTDGKTVKCTSHSCSESAEPVAVEIVPVVQSGACPRGFSYKIQCNYCFCLANGNAVCTTADCSKRGQLS